MLYKKQETLILPLDYVDVLACFQSPFSAVILTTIINIASRFVLDNVAGDCMVAVVWHAQDVKLNLLVLEHYFLRFVHIHKQSILVASTSAFSIG